MLSTIFEQILREYPYCRDNETFSGNMMGNLIRREFVASIRATDLITEHYIIKGSVGQGKWAKVPWVAIMDSRLTTTTQRGIYIVYLFAGDGSSAYLTLNQGCTDIIQNKGHTVAHKEMLFMADKIRTMISTPDGFTADNNIALGNDFYEDGCIFYKKYIAESVPKDKVLINDLKVLLDAYADYCNIVKPVSNPQLINSISKEKGKVMNDENHSDFKAWLSQKTFDIEEIASIMDSLHSIDTYISTNGNAISVFSYPNSESLNTFRKHLFLDKKFMKLSTKKGDRLYHALNLYFTFLVTTTKGDTLKITSTTIQGVKVEEQNNFGNVLVNGLAAGHSSEKISPEKQEFSRLDFSKTQSYEGTHPNSCMINGTSIYGKNWARLLFNITEMFISERNANLAVLYKQSLSQRRQTHSFIMRHKIEGLYCAQLSNGCWINLNYSIQRLINIIGRLCVHCGVNLNDVIITYSQGDGLTPAEVTVRQIALPTKSDYKFEREKISQTLGKRFTHGFRYTSVIECRKFKRFYQEIYGEPLELMDEPLIQAVRAVGFEFEERIYDPSSMLNVELKQHILDYITNLFDSGASTVYFDAVYDHFSNSLINTCIYSSDMLKNLITYWNDERIIVHKQYMLPVNKDLNNPVDDVRSCLKNAGKVISFDEIAERLPQIPRDEIYKVLVRYPEFVNIANGLYVHIDCVYLSVTDLKCIEDIIEEEIASKRYISGIELVRSVNTRLPQITEHNPEILPLGMRKAIAYHLKDKFSFNGNIVSQLGEDISMSAVFKEYARSRPCITLDELNEFKDDIGSNIYFEEIYSNKIRVNQDLFVDPAECVFDIQSIDEALSRFVNDDFLPIQAIQHFSLFPGVHHPWNSYLLESYVYSHSASYKLLHPCFSANQCTGAIVRRSSSIHDYDDLLIKALAKSGITLKKDLALNYLQQVGLISRRKLGNINQILTSATESRGKRV